MSSGLGIRIGICCFLLSLSASMLGCYGDADNDGPGGDGDGDGACLGHACGDAPINLSEGGEVRLEYVYQKDAEVEIRSSAWFAREQTPESRPWPRPPADWNEAGPVMCSDMTGNTIWPSGDPETRVYADVGEWVRYSGGGHEYELPRLMDAQDDALNNVHDIGYITQLMPADVPVDTEYSVELAGSSEVEATTYENALYLPPDYEVTFPNMKETVLVPTGEDFPLIWDAPENVDEYEFAFVSFGDQVDPMIYCIGPNSGSMEIPSELIDTLPAGGQILHGVFSHRVETINDRRLDFLGINCQLSEFIITENEL